jgi:hypothetical protein
MLQLPRNLPLKVFAGAEALAHIRRNGLQPDDIEMILGASGGPKWLCLAAMDRYLLGQWFNARQTPLHLLGTSAGAWRLSCFAQQNPLAAHGRFLDAYISQQYSDKPTPAEVAAECQRMLDLTLGEHGLQEILDNPVMRYHTLVTRCRGLVGSDRKWLQGAGWVTAMAANLVSRSAMRPWVDRVLFHHPDKPPIDYFPHLPARHVALNEQNLKSAILATGAIPMVITGIRNIAGAPAGTYRDGGITDYQFDLPVLPEKGFVLYPHYFAQVPKGGWFDKRLHWRTVSREHYRRTIIIAPSWEFAASLPGGHIPDLEDFYNYRYSQRRQRWDLVLASCERLADTLELIHHQQRWAEVAEPLPW